MQILQWIHSQYYGAACPLPGVARCRARARYSWGTNALPAMRSGLLCQWLRSWPRVLESWNYYFSERNPKCQHYSLFGKTIPYLKVLQILVWTVSFKCIENPTQTYVTTWDKASVFSPQAPRFPASGSWRTCSLSPLWIRRAYCLFLPPPFSCPHRALSSSRGTILTCAPHVWAH